MGLLLAGCATTAGGLGSSPVEATLESDKTPQAWATCVVEALMGGADLRGEGDHYWVLRTNTMGYPIIRWDFHARPGGGSRAELRASMPISHATDKVQACA